MSHGIISSLEEVDELLFRRCFLRIRLINDVIYKLLDLISRAALGLTYDLCMVHPLDEDSAVVNYEIVEIFWPLENLLFVKFLTLINSMSSSL